MGSATDIEFVVESPGLVPSADWKRQRFANDPANAVWNPGDATNLAIGQGFLAGRVNAWFIGFAPFDSPRLAVATVLEAYPEGPGRYGSQDAATATRKTLASRLGGTP